MSISKIVMRLVSISFHVLVFLVIVYGLYQLGLRSYDYGYRIFTESAVTSGEGRDRLVQVKSSMDALDLAAVLEEKGVIRDKWLFSIQLNLSEYKNAMKPGRYMLNTSMTAREMMQVMAQEDDTGESEQEKE